jgi:hypothetical protein
MAMHLARSFPRIVVAAAMSVFFAAAAVSAQDQSTWNELEPPGGGFVIRMPGIPNTEIDKETKAHQFEIRSGDRRYFVSFRDLTAGERKADPAAALEKARDAFVHSLANSEMRGSEKAPLGSSPGIVWTCDSQAADAPPIRMRGKMVLANRRLYTLIYADRKFAFDEADSARWFESFRLSS